MGQTDISKLHLGGKPFGVVVWWSVWGLAMGGGFVDIARPLGAFGMLLGTIGLPSGAFGALLGTVGVLPETWFLVVSLWSLVVSWWFLVVSWYSLVVSWWLLVVLQWSLVVSLLRDSVWTIGLPFLVLFLGAHKQNWTGGGTLLI